MDQFFNLLLKHSGCIAFIEKGKHYSYKIFIDDILQTEKEIRGQRAVAQEIISWDFVPEYKNIVLLFAYARCNALIFPANNRSLVADDDVKIIKAFNTEIKLKPGIQNVFTAELKKRDTPGLLLTSSGTGNNKKEVLLDFGMLCNKYLKLTSKYTTVLAFSLEHISGIETLLSILAPGGTIVLVPDRNLFEIASAVKEHKASLLSCTPGFLIQLYLKNLLTTDFFESIAIINCGGEPLTSYWHEILQTAIPWIKINQAFGTTETTNLRTTTDSRDVTKFKPGIYKKDYDVKEKILYLKNQNTMLGYWNDNKLLSDLWIKTSDLVEIDKEGFIRIMGREEKNINVGGKKLNPTEVEELLMQLKAIKYAKVYGEENLILGQIVAADILTDTNDFEELKKHIRRHCLSVLEEYKIPVKINRINELPITARLKLK